MWHYRLMNSKGQLNKMKLTAKQEMFAQEIVKSNNQSDSYRAAYNASKMKPESIHKRASELVRNGDVAGRIAQLREEAAKRNRVTVDDLLVELEEARQAALCAETVQSSAAVSASMSKAKLLGLDKQLIELSGEVTTRQILDDFYGSDA